MLSCHRQILRCLLTAALLLPYASCMKPKEEVAEEPATSCVRISVSLPQPMATKSISDGKLATDLHFRAYRVVDGVPRYLSELSQDIPNAFDSNLRAAISTTLNNGYIYHFILWAQSPDAETAYNLLPLEQGQPYVGVDYSSMQNSDRRMDAFTATRLNYSVIADSDLTLALTRPFAQVNFGTSDADWTDAAKSGVLIDITSLTFKNAYTRFYPLTGEVSDPVDVTFVPAALPDEALVVDSNPYRWLSMNYILVPADQSITDVSLELKSGVSHFQDIPVPNVPVRRNYRTNILSGRLITSGTRLSIVLDPVFTDGYDVPDAF